MMELKSVKFATTMDLIATTGDLAAVCARMAKHPYVTVDTEFLRETTYYPLLCVALGTGHAVQMAWPEVEQGAEAILVVAGDMPLVRTATLRRLLERHVQDRNAVTFLSGALDDPSGYGRVVRDRRGDFQKIVEEKDATAAERKVAEVNSGVYCFRRDILKDALASLGADNEQKEYYLTDTLALVKARGLRVGVVQAPDPRELFGVNTPEQLSMVEQTLRAWGEG
jgi:bifunctional UDP-N-acetylglucosamine pyrophosphorylase/glucosamine-1-phosphate N-acetyltransferase